MWVKRMNLEPVYSQMMTGYSHMTGYLQLHVTVYKWWGHRLAVYSHVLTVNSHRMTIYSHCDVDRSLLAVHEGSTLAK